MVIPAPNSDTLGKNSVQSVCESLMLVQEGFVTASGRGKRKKELGESGCSK